MKKFVLALVAVALVGAAVPANAQSQVYGVPEAAPAATLLLPYFETDLDNGLTTLFSINNASATAILTHVVFWTDWSQHSLDFNVYLTGYDVVTINIRDVFNGYLPITASAGQDPTDTISNHGILSQDINFASCNGVFPYSEPALPQFNLDLIRLGHTGKPVPDFGNRCIGENHGDNIARGYVTIDTVNQCSVAFQTDPGYFGDGGTGIVTNQNVIWGDFFIIDEHNNFAFGDNLVSIQADPGSGLNGGIGASLPDSTGYTFYGRYVAGTGIDNREPLGQSWASRFLNGGAFDGGTDLIVWRDSTMLQNPDNGFTCGSHPAWWPLTQEQIVIFDEEENPVVPEGCQVSPCPPEIGLLPFPLETQRVAVGDGALPVPYDFGWLYLDLNFIQNDTPSGGALDVDFGGDGQLAQSYVMTSHSAAGRFQVGYPATLLKTALELHTGPQIYIY